MKNGSPTSTYADMRPIAVRPADLAHELLPLPDRVGDHVEEPGERAADLALDGHGVDHEREVLRADALGHVGERVVHRLPELGLGEHAPELVGGGLGAFVDDRLNALAEADARPSATRRS